MSEPLLQLEGLSVRYSLRAGLFARAAFLPALEDVSLELRAGEALGIVGESGSGKSTLARAVLRLVRASSGRIVWLGRELQGLSARQLRPLRRELQMVFQDPLASLDPRMTIGQIVAEPLRVHCRELSQAVRAQRVSAALSRVGLAGDIVNHYPHQFSGGQCQRIAIARAMIVQPRLLVCDEPVSALDVSIQAQIINLLRDLKADSGLSVLFVSHNLAVVRRLCERVAVLYLGRVLEIGPSDALYARPLHPYTRGLLDAVPLPDPERQPARLAIALGGEPPSPLAPPSGCVFRTRCAYAIALCASARPALERSDATREVACHRWRELEAARAAR